MQPIVNGLETMYSDEVDFYYLNAEDGGQGQAAFQHFALRGHPALVMVDTSGDVAWIKIGVVPAEEVQSDLLSIRQP